MCNIPTHLPVSIGVVAVLHRGLHLCILSIERVVFGESLECVSSLYNVAATLFSGNIYHLDYWNTPSIHHVAGLVSSLSFVERGWYNVVTRLFNNTRTYTDVYNVVTRLRHPQITH